MVQRESGISRTLILYVAKSRLGTVLNSHSHSTFHRVWIKNQQLPKSQNCFSMQSHAVSLVTMVIHSRAKHFHFTTFVMLQGLKDWHSEFWAPQLGETTSANSVWARDLFPQWRIHMGKSYQKLTGKCKKQKSICIFGSIFIASSQRHIQWGLQAIWGRDGEKRKRMSREHGSFSICWMQFLDFCNQTGIICIICNMQYRKSTILCWFI